MCNCEKSEDFKPGAVHEVESYRARNLLAGQPEDRDSRRPKFIDILDAIEHLVGARRGVQRLCDEIVGVKVQGSMPDNSKKPEIEPCLLDILDNTPGRISQEVDMINGAVNEIRAQIL